ncbi:MAG: hypothetical protein Q8Q00_07200 [Dehalococcoidia bacterium]|nr:hypothetical protein [Dehalococcoidia bacterium]
MDSHIVRSHADIFRLHPKLGDSRALRRILLLARAAGLKLVQVTKEDDSDHAEWLAEREYLKSVGEPCDGPTRLDFFGGHVGPLHNPRLDAGNHLGYALVRSGKFRSVLEAWIKTPAEPSCYLNCACETVETVPLHKGGPPFRSVLRSVPFLEQDGHTGCCAHACVRGATLLLASRFGTPALTYPAISKAAGVTNGKRGLTYTQIMRALEAAGCNAFAYQGGELFGLDQITYHFNESGFPVILGIETDGDVGHALLIVGHEFDSHAWWPDAERGYYPSLGDGRDWLSSGLWTGNFVAHDDNFGPYMNVHRSVVREKGLVAIVPIPRTILLGYDLLAAEAVAALVLSNDLVVSALRLGSGSPWKEALLPKGERLRPVLRTLLLSSTDARAHLEESAYPPRIRAAYRNTPLPDWVYFVEVSIASMYGPMLKLGEILLDPAVDIAANPERAIDAVLLIHLPGLFWKMPFTSDAEPLYVDTDKPASLLQRPTFAQLSRQP